MTIAQLTIFFGWTTIIHLVVFLIAVLFIIACGNRASKIFSRLLCIEEKDFHRICIKWVARYELLLITVSLVPYLALKIMGW